MSNPIRNKISLCGKSRLRRISRSLLAAACILVITIGSASSFNPHNMDMNTGNKNIKKPLLSVENACRSLLNPIQNTSSLAPADKDQRKAGKLVALGVILGARFALEPKDAPESDVQSASVSSKASTRDTKAGSIIRYRDCIKKETLALSQNTQDNKQL